MPNFKKNTDYSMKGSSFYGHGNSSPAKVSDKMVVEAHDKLKGIEHDWKTPGWAKAAGKVWGDVSSMANKYNPLAKGGKGASSSNGGDGGKGAAGGGKGAAGSVQKGASGKLLKEDYKLGDYGSSTSMQV